jgi:hypothetical protein
MLRKAVSSLRARSFADGVNLKHSSQLQVVHTNQWPIPYYKRLTFVPRNIYPDSDYNVSIFNNTVGAPDDVNVYLARQELEGSMKGREILATMQATVVKGDWNTRVKHVEEVAETYMEDLLEHIDYTQQENARILKKHRLSDVFN